MKIDRRIASASAVLTMGALLTGCQHPAGASTAFDDIYRDLTPELIGLQERPIDSTRHYAIKVNSDQRATHDDFNRVMYSDHPSRLSPFPILYTSGQPR